ncbi:hydroxyethylthiazole kinase [Carnobacterium gallinarum]|uniref:hydroxyethylthiazole kinase n=1 Tax=Carnobacterium gallinarum TaxID=2749 RepID=UPI0005514660|nr:hydroxyethylthiazole kinase [Carnobacterium gallinarum]
MNSELVEKVRRQNPLVHNITNIVVANDSANGLLAIGASPFMSNSFDEMGDVTQLADAIVLNIGTLDASQITTMKEVGRIGNQLNKPIVFDPVGAGATAYRKQVTEELLNEVKFALIKGNAGEIAAIANADWEAKGVDAGNGTGDIAEIAKQVAKRYQCLVGVSGAEDIITDGVQVIRVRNGTDYFPKMTGSGCLLSCICGAFLGVVDSVTDLTAVATAFTMYGLAGELAADKLPECLVGSFRMNLLDELSVMTGEKLFEKGRIYYDISEN